MMMVCDCCGRTYYAAAGERTCAYCLLDRQDAARAGYVHDASSHHDGTFAPRERVLPAWRKRSADGDGLAIDLTGSVRA